MDKCLKTHSFEVTKYYMYQLCFLYMLNYPVIYLLSERKAEVNMQGIVVYLSKIENGS